VLPVIMA